MLVEDHPQKPGEFKYYKFQGNKELAGLNFRCPCGCGAMLGAAFKQFKKGKGPIWNLNLKKGKEVPTVTPSIKYLDGCGWHGYLTKGVFIGRCESKEKVK